MVRYESALRDSSASSTDERVVTRLAEARARASDAHLQACDRFATAGDPERALQEAEAALRLGRTALSAERVRDLGAVVAARSLDSGRGALAAGRWDEAVRLLRRAQELAPSAETQELLGRAQSGADQLRSKESGDAMMQAEAAMRSEDWASAAALFTAANTARPSPRSAQLATYCDARAQADAEVRAQRFGRARSQFARAVATGIDTESVRLRMRETVPSVYRVTIHGAAVLPFKPGSERAWDGLGGRVPGAGNILSKLAGATGPEAMVINSPLRNPVAADA